MVVTVQIYQLRCVRVNVDSMSTWNSRRRVLFKLARGEQQREVNNERFVLIVQR
jgi:hypothetical protein